MDLQLKGKTALVTGSTKGIGRGIAEALHAEGADVVVNGRSADDVERVAGEIGCRGVAADVSDADETRRLVEACGDLDVLVNNTGIFEPKPFAEIGDNDWRRFFEVNVLSGARLSRLVLGGMTGRGFGRIVFVSSESGVNVSEAMVHYSMTKTAQLSISRGIAKVAAGSGVTCNCVLPGPTWTEGVEGFLESNGLTRETFFEEARPGSLTGRFGTPEEIGAAVAYLCSPLAGNTTGSALRSDGGLVDTPW